MTGFIRPRKTALAPSRSRPGRTLTDQALWCAGLAAETLDPLREERIDDHLLALVCLDLGSRSQALQRFLRHRLRESQPLEHGGAVGRALAGEDRSHCLLLRGVEAPPLRLVLGLELVEGGAVRALPVVQGR